MSDMNRKNEADLNGNLEKARRHIAASAEAVSYRADIKNRAKDAIEQAKGNVLAAIAQTFDTAKTSVQKAASTAQDTASDLSERARPHVEAAIENVQSAADRVGENLAPVVESVREVAESAVATVQYVADAASDAIVHAKES